MESISRNYKTEDYPTVVGELHTLLQKYSGANMSASSSPSSNDDVILTNTETRVEQGDNQLDSINNNAMGKKSGRQIPGNAARERSRVKTLRTAFQDLQKSLPSVPADTKLSKLDILVLATTYIGHLMRTLEEGATQQQCQMTWDNALSTHLEADWACKGYYHPVKKWPMRSRLYAGMTNAQKINVTEVELPTNMIEVNSKDQAIPQVSNQLIQVKSESSSPTPLEESPSKCNTAGQPFTPVQTLGLISLENISSAASRTAMTLEQQNISKYIPVCHNNIITSNISTQYKGATSTALLLPADKIRSDGQGLTKSVLSKHIKGMPPTIISPTGHCNSTSHRLEVQQTMPHNKQMPLINHVLASGSQARISALSLTPLGNVAPGTQEIDTVTSLLSTTSKDVTQTLCPRNKSQRHVYQFPT